jgi:hypothetical protein
VHRFASPELANTVDRLWRRDIENPEVRQLLLKVIGAGKISACAEIAHDVAMEGDRNLHERSLAIEALLQLNDQRIERLAHSLNGSSTMARRRGRRAMIELFPKHLPIPRFLKILGRVKEAPRTVGELNFRFPRAIENGDVATTLELRQTLSI